MKDRRRKSDKTEERIFALEIATRANKDTIRLHGEKLDKVINGQSELNKNQEILIKQMEPFTNTEIAVKWISRVLLWAAGISGSIAAVWHLWDKIKSP